MTDLGQSPAGLPQARGPEARPARGDARRPDAAVVLAVDDVPANLAVLHELLSPEHRVRIATNGPRALHLAHSAPTPDLILLDVMMPGMDGFEVLARLREDPVTVDVPVVFVTAREDAHDEERGLDLGAADYITKPYDPVTVLARVRAQLELRRARRALADRNAALESEVARRLVENERIRDVTIHALARLAEKRDGDTGNHLRRTQEYVRLLAERLRTGARDARVLDGAAVAALARSAPLHDIGKVAIPDHILRKPGPLTDAEWVTMRTHAREGRDAIERAERDLGGPADFLAYAKEIAAHHHERWDGTGYPDGLAGEAIPLSARLMALADVFDALTTERCYKAAMPVAEARERIVAERGRQFDPVIVDAFLASFGAFEDVANRLRDPAERSAG